MSRRPVHVEDRGSTFVVRGWEAHRLALSAGAKTVYNGVAGGWVGDGRKLPHLVAYLEHLGVRVEVTGRRSDDHRHRHDHRHAGHLDSDGDDHDNGQLGLFGSDGGIS